MKKLLALLIATLVMLTGTVGCKANNDGALSQFKDRPNEVVVYYSSNAYGGDWLTKIAEKYMTTHNDDTYINVKKTVEQTSDLAKIESGVAVGDLYLLDMHLEDKTFAYEDISDVYDSYPIGETAKTVGQKLDPAYQNYYKNSGAYNYVMPKTSVFGGYNFAYNKTVLDSIMPEGYSLPRTTNEFVELGSAIKDDAYLLVNSFYDSSDYGKYMYNAWFAQLIGYDAYENYRMGRYFDAAQGKYVFDESSPTYYTKYRDSIQDFYEILESIYTKDSGYIHSDSISLGAMEAESVLAGFGFGPNKKPAVFMINGTYLEQELGWMLEEQKAANNPQEIRMMQMPVASEIIKRTPSIETDQELRTVIDYVDKILDGETATKPADVEDADIEIIKEARTICGLYMAGGMVIPKAANNKAGAKEFIRYLASDEAAVIAAQYTNGTDFLPFGKDVSEEELGAPRTDFMNDCIKIDKRTTRFCSSDSQEYKFTYVTKIGILYGNKNITSYLAGFYNGTNTATKETFYQTSYNEISNNWERLVTEFKNQGGNTAN
ncbi:MAG: extracellular solute-binding protein [Clostridiales bacterium]|nr:extracellular solute-binding protein [Clostridiales bacterium]